jgi:putative transposase
MPWKECQVMDERLRFVARRLEGESMSSLCEEFGISRKTGYKIFERYRQIGVKGLSDRSRRPHRHANQLPLVVEKSIVGLKREYPSWGAPKIRERLRHRWPSIACPAISTVHAVLDRHGLVRRRRRRVRPRLRGTPLSQPVAPNRLWCADYKGEFLLANYRYCYPLTITDFASRYLLACEALTTTKERYAFAVFERAFQEFGLPEAIRTDNGVPFASAHALYGLSKLAVWWLRLGIGLERIAPGHPEQNGRHERLHLTLKMEATRPAADNALQQQGRFDTFAHHSNHERPHQALDMATRASRYQPSTRPYQGLVAELDYPTHDWTAVVTTCGRICYQGRKINVSQVFAGQKVGVRQTEDHIWLVTFMDYDLGYFDDETGRLEPIDNPFGSKLLPMSPEWTI